MLKLPGIRDGLFNRLALLTDLVTEFVDVYPCLTRNVGHVHLASPVDEAHIRVAVLTLLMMGGPAAVFL
mgnify:CR=1 FL=1